MMETIMSIPLDSLEAMQRWRGRERGRGRREREGRGEEREREGRGEERERGEMERRDLTCMWSQSMREDCLCSLLSQIH